MSVDHVVVVVRHLPAAMEDFSKLGFRVVPGGRHEGGLTHNALIVFEDGSYLELFAPTAPWIMRVLAMLKRLGLLGWITSNRSAIVRRFLEHVAGGEGFADIALLSSNLDRQLAAAREQGLALDGPLPGGRTRPDGQQVQWRFGVPLANGLPFLIEDLTARALRVPEGDVRQHANGVRGIAGIVVEVPDLSRAAASYGALVGIANDSGMRASPTSTRTRDFRVGTAVITLVERADRTAASGDSSTAAPRRFSLVLRTADKAAVGPLDSRQTHNAAIELAAS